FSPEKFIRSVTAAVLANWPVMGRGFLAKSNSRPNNGRRPACSRTAQKVFTFIRQAFHRTRQRKNGCVACLSTSRRIIRFGHTTASNGTLCFFCTVGRKYSSATRG